MPVGTVIAEDVVLIRQGSGYANRNGLFSRIQMAGTLHLSRKNRLHKALFAEANTQHLPMKTNQKISWKIQVPAMISFHDPSLISRTAWLSG
jgi:hypothetical protein